MIFIEDQHIKLNGVVLPGVFKRIEIKSSARIDEQTVEGSATKPKQATGYEDAKITLELIIDDTEKQTKYQRFAVLRGLFRKSGQAVPQPIPIVSEDTAAHGITHVLFKELTHTSDNKRDYLTANVELWEYIPQTIKTQKAPATKTAASTKNNIATKKVTSGTTTKPVSKPGGSFSGSGAGRGGASSSSAGRDGTSKPSSTVKAKNVGKSAKSPAKDTANPSALKARISKRQRK